MQYEQFTAAVASVVQQSAKLEQSVNRSFAELQDSARRSLTGVKKELAGFNADALASTLTAGVKAAGSAFSSILQPATEFDSQLRRVNQIAKLSDSQLADLGDSIRQINKDLGGGVQPAEATAAAYEILSSGFSNTADAQKVLSSALLAAQAGGEESDKVAKLLTGTLNAYGASADQAAKFTDILFEGVNAGAQTVPQLVQSLGLVTGIASAAGVSFAELNASIATLTTSGLQTSTAVEGLRGLLNGLVNPTKESRDEMERLGITIDAQSVKQDGLLKTIQKIKAATGDNTAAMAKLVGGQEALTVALKLSGDGGQKFAGILKQIEGANGSTAAAYQQTAKSFAQQQKIFAAALADLEVTVGAKVLPVLISLTKAAKGVVDVIAGLPEPVKIGALAITGMAVAGAGLVASLATVAATGPRLIAFVLDLGVRAGPVAAKALTGLNFLLTTNVTRAGLAAAATNGLATAQKGWAAAQTAAAAAVGSLNGALGVSISRLALATLGWAGLAAGLIYAAKKYADWNLQQKIDADNAVSASGRNVKGGTPGTASTGTILAAKSATDLIKQGVDEIDVVNRIRALKSQVRDLFADAAKSGRDVDQAAVDRLRQTIGRLEQVQVALHKAAEDQRQAEGAASKLPATTPGKTRAEDKKDAQDAIRDQLQQIKLSDESTKKKIQDTLALLNLYGAEGALRRQIDQQVHALRVQLQREEEKASKEAMREKLRNELTAIDTSKAGEAAKIAALERLKTAYGKDGEIRRQLEEKIFALKERQAKKEEEDIKRLSSLRQEALQQDLDLQQAAQAELERSRGRGVDTSAAREKNQADQAKTRKEQIDAELKGQLADRDLTDAAKAQLRERARRAKEAVDRELLTQQRDARQQGQEDQAGQRQTLDQADIALADRKVQLLQEQLATGKDVQGQLKAAVLERLRVQEDEIAAELRLARLRTDSPELAAAAESAAAVRILDARRAANEEIKRGTEALRQQREEQRQSDAAQGGGQLLSLDQFLKQQSDSFGIEAVRKRQDQIRQANAAPTATPVVPGIGGLDTRTLERQVLDSKPTARASLDGRIAVDVQVSVDQNGRATSTVRPAVTTDGKNSDVQYAVTEMNGRRR